MGGTTPGVKNFHVVEGRKVLAGEREQRGQKRGKEVNNVGSFWQENCDKILGELVEKSFSVFSFIP